MHEQGRTARWEHDSIGESKERDEHVEEDAGREPADHEMTERVVGERGVDVRRAAVIDAFVPVAVLSIPTVGFGRKDGQEGLGRHWGGVALLEPLHQHVVAHRRKLAPLLPPPVDHPAAALHAELAVSAIALVCPCQSAARKRAAPTTAA